MPNAKFPLNVRLYNFLNPIHPINPIQLKGLRSQTVLTRWVIESGVERERERDSNTTILLLLSCLCQLISFFLFEDNLIVGSVNMNIGHFYWKYQEVLIAFKLPKIASLYSLFTPPVVVASSFPFLFLFENFLCDWLPCIIELLYSKRYSFVG